MAPGQPLNSKAGLLHFFAGRNQHVSRVSDASRAPRLLSKPSHLQPQARPESMQCVALVRWHMRRARGPRQAHGLRVRLAFAREQAYDEELLGALRQHVLEPLARSCEYELRVHLVSRPRLGASRFRSRRWDRAASSGQA